MAQWVKHLPYKLGGFCLISGSHRKMQEEKRTGSPEVVQWIEVPVTSLVSQV